MDRWDDGGAAGLGYKWMAKIYRLGADIKIISFCGFWCEHIPHTPSQREQTFHRWRLGNWRRLNANLAFFFLWLFSCINGKWN